MITNVDVFNALKTLQAFCAEGCADCPFDINNGEDCAFDLMRENVWCDLPAHWDIESLRPLLDLPSTASDH